jgi:hypothetical protein
VGIGYSSMGRGPNLQYVQGVVRGIVIDTDKKFVNGTVGRATESDVRRHMDIQGCTVTRPVQASQQNQCRGSVEPQ